MCVKSGSGYTWMGSFQKNLWQAAIYIKIEQPLEKKKKVMVIILPKDDIFSITYEYLQFVHNRRKKLN